MDLCKQFIFNFSNPPVSIRGICHTLRSKILSWINFGINLFCLGYYILKVNNNKLIYNWGSYSILKTKLVMNNAPNSTNLFPYTCLTGTVDPHPILCNIVYMSVICELIDK